MTGIIRSVHSKQYFVYILSNFTKTVLYTGVTNDLVRRIWEHKQEVVKGFSQQYHTHDFVYYEVFKEPKSAIEREKQIKGWTRKKKDELIIRFNPSLKDLYQGIL